MNILVAYVALSVLAAPATGGVKTPVQTAQVKVQIDPLVKGILAVRGHFKYVTPEFAARLAKEVRELLKRPGNEWLKPAELIGLAINESDLRSWLRQGLDCGITQVRVNVVRKYRYQQRALCYQLSKSTRLSFEWAIAALNRIHHRYCRQWTGQQHRRCVMNVYFQGPVVRNRRKCKRRKHEWSTAESIETRYRRCVYDNRYWLRHKCFAEGVRLGRKASHSCRRVTSNGWIRRAYKVRRVVKPLKRASLPR